MKKIKKIYAFAILSSLLVSTATANSVSLKFRASETTTTNCGYVLSAEAPTWRVTMNYGATGALGDKYVSGSGVAGLDGKSDFGRKSGSISTDVSGANKNVYGSYSYRYMTGSTNSTTFKNGSYTTVKSRLPVYDGNPVCNGVSIKSGKQCGVYISAGTVVELKAYDEKSGFSGCSTSASKTVTMNSSGSAGAMFTTEFGSSVYCSANYRVLTSKPSGCYISYGVNQYTNQPYSVTMRGCTSPAGGSNLSPSTTITSEYQTGSLTASDCLGLSTTLSYADKWLDITAPSCGAVNYQRPASGIYVNNNVPFTVGCSDNRSGCTSGSYGGSMYGGTGSTTIRDVAGNTNSCRADNNFSDVDKPNVSINVEASHNDNSIDNQTSDARVSGTITASDAKAGIEKVCYRLEGATSQGERCSASGVASIPFEIQNDGNTKIIAYAYDKAHSYSNGSFVYQGGNRSNDVTRNIYIDRTKPNATEALSKGKFLQAIGYDVNAGGWTNITPTVQANLEDTIINAGTSYASRSGLGSVEWVWTLTNDPIAVWGAVDRNHVANEVVPKVTINGSTYKKEETSSTVMTWKPQTTLVTSDKLNDEVYLHARVCDKAVGTYKNKQPNCSTAVIGTFRFDDKAPNVNDITALDNNGNSLNQHDWTNKLKISFGGKETILNRDGTHPSGSGQAATSGLSKISLYYSNNSPHVTTLTMNQATFNQTPDNEATCNAEKTCTYKIDFNALSNRPVYGNNKVMAEGTRYIKVRVTDVAGNYSEKTFGPYRFDITSPAIGDKIEVDGTNGGFVPLG